MKMNDLEYMKIDEIPIKNPLNKIGYLENAGSCISTSNDFNNFYILGQQVPDTQILVMRPSSSSASQCSQGIFIIYYFKKFTNPNRFFYLSTSFLSILKLKKNSVCQLQI